MNIQIQLLRKLKNENNLLKNQTCITIDMRNHSDRSSNNSDVVIVSPLDGLQMNRGELNKKDIRFKNRDFMENKEIQRIRKL